MKLRHLLYQFRGATCVSRNLVAIAKDILIMLAARRCHHAHAFEALTCLILNRLAVRS
jgi:hypothetical protein